MGGNGQIRNSKKKSEKGYMSVLLRRWWKNKNVAEPLPILSNGCWGDKKNGGTPYPFISKWAAGAIKILRNPLPFILNGLWGDKIFAEPPPIYSKWALGR